MDIDYANAGLVPLALRNIEHHVVQTQFVTRANFQAKGIPYTLLKGMYMIQHEYRDFGCRRIGDVDINNSGQRPT